MRAYCGSGGIAPHILALVTICRWVVSFTQRPLYSQGKSHSYNYFASSLKSSHIFVGSRGSSVDTATGHGLDGRSSGIRFQSVLGISFFSTASRPALGPTQLPIQWVPGPLPPGSKATGAWSWPLTSFYCRSQRIRGAIPPLPHYEFMACCLVKHGTILSLSLSSVFIFVITNFRT